MRRLMWTISLIVALVVIATGCGSGTGGTAPASGQKPSGAAPASQAKPAEGGAKEILDALAKLPEAERTQKLHEEAKKEGKLVGYVTGSIDSWEAWKRDFEKKFPGVTFEFLRGGSDELLEKMLAEARAGKLEPDIIVNSKAHVLIDEGLLIPYTSPAKERVPAIFRNEYTADTDVNPIVIAWNTNLVKPQDAPKNWEDLLDPKWKGRKIALDVIPDVMMFGFYRKWGVEKGREYLRKLMAQDLIPSRSHTTALDQLAAGEFPVCAEIYGYNAINIARGKKAPIAWALPDPMPTTGGGLNIAKTTKRPHAAALFYDYIMSADAGTLYAEFGRIPIQPGAKMKYPEDQKAMMEHKGLINFSAEDYRTLFPTVQEDLKNIIQPALGQ